MKIWGLQSKVGQLNKLLRLLSDSLVLDSHLYSFWSLTHSTLEAFNSNRNTSPIYSLINPFCLLGHLSRLWFFWYIDIRPIKLINYKLQLHYNDILHNINIIFILGRYRTFRSQGGTQAPNRKIFEWCFFIKNYLFMNF